MRSLLKKTFPFMFALAFAVGCGTQNCLVNSDIPSDQNNVPERPKGKSSINDFEDAIDKQFANPIENLFDFPRQARIIAGKQAEALNINSFDEVNNSSWFTNRNAVARMSLENIAKGPNKGNGPDTSDTWTITRAKADGVTPGFAIKDSRGDRYFIKFDPSGYNELASGAEVVCTKFFYAAGYFTPENFVTFFRVNRLRMGKQVKFVDEKGRKRYMNEKDLSEILERVEVDENGYTRALASKYIPGRPLGPFRYEGIWKDDPNDFIPHQHRRELRGLYVLGSWLNHIDSKAQNSLDTYIEENGISFIKHYLIDFGTCLGSGGRGPHPGYRGHENEIDPCAILRKILTLGLYVRKYEKPNDVFFPSIGRYTTEGFNPGSFKSIFPNPAYANMTLRDAFWGTKIVTSFTDDQIKSVVKTGKYSDRSAEEYLIGQLIARRDIIGKYWYSKVAPLDSFVIEGDGIKFKDLALICDYYSLSETDYTAYLLSHNGDKKTELVVHDSKIFIPKDLKCGKHSIFIKVFRNNHFIGDPVVINILTDNTSRNIISIQR